MGVKTKKVKSGASTNEDILKEYLQDTNYLDEPTLLQGLSETIECLYELNVDYETHKRCVEVLTRLIFPSDDTENLIYDILIRQRHQKHNEIRLDTVESLLSTHKKKIYFTTSGKKHFFYGPNTFYYREALKTHGSWGEYLSKDNQKIRAWRLGDHGKSFMTDHNAEIEFVYDPSANTNESKRIDKFA